LLSAPCHRVIERPALELLARSVASSSGDLRAAIKAACTALRRAQEAAGPAQQLKSPRKVPQEQVPLSGQQQQQQQQQLRSPAKGLKSPSKHLLRSPGKQQVLSPLKAGAAAAAAAAAAQAAVVPVGVRDMMAVLSNLTGEGLLCMYPTLSFTAQRPPCFPMPST
jgi:hypothetical protein